MFLLEYLESLVVALKWVILQLWRITTYSKTTMFIENKTIFKMNSKILNWRKYCNTVILMKTEEKREVTEYCGLYICAVYSADVIDDHKASRAAYGESSDVTLLSQNVRAACASPDSRAVIILVPVRLGGEKTNPDYFNLAKVRHAPTLQSLKYLYGNSPHPFLHLEHSEPGLLHRHHWREAQTGLLLCWISRLVWAWYKTEIHTTSCWGVKKDYFA